MNEQEIKLKKQREIEIRSEIRGALVFAGDAVFSPELELEFEEQDGLKPLDMKQKLKILDGIQILADGGELDKEDPLYLEMYSFIVPMPDDRLKTLGFTRDEYNKIKKNAYEEHIALFKEEYFKENKGEVNLSEINDKVSEFPEKSEKKGVSHLPQKVKYERKILPKQDTKLGQVMTAFMGILNPALYLDANSHHQGGRNSIFTISSSSSKKNYRKSLLKRQLSILCDIFVCSKTWKDMDEESHKKLLELFAKNQLETYSVAKVEAIITDIFACFQQTSENYFFKMLSLFLFDNRDLGKEFFLNILNNAQYAKSSNVASKLKSIVNNMYEDYPNSIGVGNSKFFRKASQELEGQFIEIKKNHDIQEQNYKQQAGKKKLNSSSFDETASNKEFQELHQWERTEICKYYYTNPFKIPNGIHQDSINMSEQIWQRLNTPQRKQLLGVIYSNNNSLISPENLSSVQVEILPEYSHLPWKLFENCHDFKSFVSDESKRLGRNRSIGKYWKECMTLDQKYEYIKVFHIKYPKEKLPKEVLINKRTGGDKPNSLANISIRKPENEQIENRLDYLIKDADGKYTHTLNMDLGNSEFAQTIEKGLRNTNIQENLNSQKNDDHQPKIEITSISTQSDQNIKMIFQNTNTGDKEINVIEAKDQKQKTSSSTKTPDLTTKLLEEAKKLTKGYHQIINNLKSLPIKPFKLTEKENTSSQEVITKSQITQKEEVKRGTKTNPNQDLLLLKEKIFENNSITKSTDEKINPTDQGSEVFLNKPSSTYNNQPTFFKEDSKNFEKVDSCKNTLVTNLNSILQSFLKTYSNPKILAETKFILSLEALYKVTSDQWADLEDMRKILEKYNVSAYWGPRANLGEKDELLLEKSMQLYKIYGTLFDRSIKNIDELSERICKQFESIDKTESQGLQPEKIDKIFKEEKDRIEDAINQFDSVLTLEEKKRSHLDLSEKSFLGLSSYLKAKGGIFKREWNYADWTWTDFFNDIKRLKAEQDSNKDSSSNRNSWFNGSKNTIEKENLNAEDLKKAIKFFYATFVTNSTHDVDSSHKREAVYEMLNQCFDALINSPQEDKVTLLPHIVAGYSDKINNLAWEAVDRNRSLIKIIQQACEVIYNGFTKIETHKNNPKFADFLNAILLETLSSESLAITNSIK